MLTNILGKLYPYTNGILVSTVNGILDRNQKDKSNYTVEYIDDARSAAFYAFGATKTYNKPSVLLLTSDDILSSYTALFEAKYQETTVYAIVLNNRNNFSFLDFCSYKRIKIKNQSDIEALDITEANIYGPVIFEIDSNYEQKNNNSERINVELFTGLVESLNKIYISGIGVSGKAPCELIENIEYGYGTISKFFGCSYYSRKKNILCCSAKEAIRDLNIFNCRYKNKNMIIVIYDSDEYLFEYKDWVESNDFEYIEGEQLTKDLLSKVIHNNCDSVIRIKK